MKKVGDPVGYNHRLSLQTGKFPCLSRMSDETNALSESVVFLCSVSVLVCCRQCLSNRDGKNSRGRLRLLPASAVVTLWSGSLETG